MKGLVTCVVFALLLVWEAGAVCPGGWTSHVYTNGATLSGFVASYPNLVTFGSSASVLSRGAVGSFVLETTLPHHEVALNRLQFNLRNIWRYEIELTYLDGSRTLQTREFMEELENQGTQEEQGNQRRHREFDSEVTRLVPTTSAPNPEVLPLSEIVRGLNVRSLGIRITDRRDSQERSRAIIQNINIEMCSRRQGQDHFGFQEICTPEGLIGCYNGGICSANDTATNGFFCDCRDGYEGDRCELIVDRDEEEEEEDDLDRAPLTSYYVHTVCEGDDWLLTCPRGYEVRVQDAIFGRNDSYTCVNTYDDLFPVGQRCQTADTLGVMQERCDGRQRCEGRATVDDLDPRRTGECETFVAKKLSVSYVCRQKVYRVETCEAGGQVLLACPKGQHIVTVSAFFGRISGNRCVHDSVSEFTPCGTFSANQTFRNLCDGKDKCMVDPRSDVFGDPCPSVFKYMELEYMCSECENVHHSDEECEYWANLGNCSNSSWMIDRCFRACSMCQSPENMCFNVYSDIDCERWAEDDQCVVNPEWMYPHCRQTCLRCDRGTDCYNFNETACEQMAEDDMCRSNVTYMFRECRGACYDCTGDVRGIHFENLYWDDEQCMIWALTGECARNPGYMLTRCWAACTGRTGPTPCVNLYENATQCDVWKGEGECETNPSWMLNHCWRSCTECVPREPVCENKWTDEAECNYWRHIGELSRPESKAFMLEECFKTATGCQPPKPVDMCINSYENEDSTCEEWRDDGECHVNPFWMHFYCNRACTNCAPGYMGDFYLAGNPALPGEAFDFTRGKTIIFDSGFRFTGKLTHFTAMFADLNPVTLQVMRRNVVTDAWEVRYTTTVRPRAVNTVETVMVESDRCINVRQGDRIGFTSQYHVAPIAFSVGEDGEEVTAYMREALTTQEFKQMSRPYKFSLGAGYEPQTVCDGEERDRMTRITDVVWIDLSIGGRDMGNITLGLFGEIAPLTVENLVGLMQGSLAAGNGYTGAIFHRIISNFMMQGGDYLTSEGFGHSCSIWGREFDDETFQLLHRCGRVSMANAGPNTNGCQFVIQFVDAAPWLDGKHVVFGVVLDGFDIVREAERVRTGDNDRPLDTVLMKRTGVRANPEPYPWWDLDTPVGDCQY